MSYHIRFAPVSVREDWIKGFRLRDRDTGEDVDLTGTVVDLNFYRERDDSCAWSLLSATSANNPDIITFPYTGVILVTYLAAASTSFGSLASGNYQVILRVVKNGLTRELVRGILPVTGPR